MSLKTKPLPDMEELVAIYTKQQGANAGKKRANDELAFLAVLRRLNALPPGNENEQLFMIREINNLSGRYFGEPVAEELLKDFFWKCNKYLIEKRDCFIMPGALPEYVRIPVEEMDRVAERLKEQNSSITYQIQECENVLWILDVMRYYRPEIRDDIDRHAKIVDRLKRRLKRNTKILEDISHREDYHFLDLLKIPSVSIKRLWGETLRYEGYETSPYIYSNYAMILKSEIPKDVASMLLYWPNNFYNRDATKEDVEATWNKIQPTEDARLESVGVINYALPLWYLRCERFWVMVSAQLANCILKMMGGKSEKDFNYYYYLYNADKVEVYSSNKPYARGGQIVITRAGKRDKIALMPMASPLRFHNYTIDLSDAKTRT